MNPVPGGIPKRELKVATTCAAKGAASLNPEKGVESSSARPLGQNHKGMNPEKGVESRDDVDSQLLHHLGNPEKGVERFLGSGTTLIAAARIPKRELKVP